MEWEGEMPKACGVGKEALASVKPCGLVKVGHVKYKLGW
jgi:hypothetical protein